MAPQLLTPFMTPGPVISPLNATAFRLNSSELSKNKTGFSHGLAVVTVLPDSARESKIQDTEIIHGSFSAIYRKYRWFLGHRIPLYQQNDTKKTYQIIDKHYLEVEALPGSKLKATEDDIAVYAVQDGQLHEAPVANVLNSVAPLHIRSPGNSSQDATIAHSLVTSDVSLTKPINVRSSAIDHRECQVPLELSKKSKKRIKRLGQKFRRKDERVTPRHMAQMVEAVNLERRRHSHKDADWDQWRSFVTNSDKLKLAIPKATWLSLDRNPYCVELDEAWKQIFLFADVFEDGEVCLDETETKGKMKDDIARRLVKEPMWFHMLWESWYDCPKLWNILTEEKVIWRAKDTRAVYERSLAESEKHRVSLELSSDFKKAIKKFNKQSKSRVKAGHLYKLAISMRTEANRHRHKHEHAEWSTFGTMAREFESSVDKVGMYGTKWWAFAGRTPGEYCDTIDQDWSNIFVVVNAIKDEKIFEDELQVRNAGRLLVKEKRWHKLFKYTWRWCVPPDQIEHILDKRAYEVGIDPMVTMNASSISRRQMTEDSQAQGSTSIEDDTTDVPLIDDSEDFDLGFQPLASSADAEQVGKIALLCIGALLGFGIVGWSIRVLILRYRQKRRNKRSQQTILPGMWKSPTERHL